MFGFTTFVILKIKSLQITFKKKSINSIIIYNTYIKYSKYIKTFKFCTSYFHLIFFVRKKIIYIYINQVSYELLIYEVK